MTIMLHHVAINAVDPAALSAFYCDAGSFQPVELADTATWLAASNFHLAIYAAEQADPHQQDRSVSDQGVGHFCLQSGDGEQLWQKLSDRGMKFNDRPVALGTGAIYAYGRDTEHNLVEVEGVPGSDPQTPVWLAHIALVSSDIQRLTAFYNNFLGREAHREGRFQNPLFSKVTGLEDVDLSAAWIKTASVQLELWQYHNPPTKPSDPPALGDAGYRYVAFQCDDLEAERTRLAENQIIVEPGEPIAGQPALWVRDPDGTRIALVEMGPDSPLSRSRLAEPDIVVRRLAAA